MCHISNIKLFMSLVTMSHVPNANSLSHRPYSYLLPYFPNRKCICKSQNIKMSVSHKIVIYRVLSEAGRPMRTDNGMRWS